MREVLTGPAAPGGEAGARVARVVLVTSALPREGKSTLTVSLARVAAGRGPAGHGGRRRPAEALAARAGRPQAGAGLVEVLRREVTLAEAVVIDPRAA